MSKRLDLRMIDLHRQDSRRREYSLDVPVGDEDDTTMGDTLAGDTNVDDSELTIDATVLELMTLMLDLKGRLGSRAGNPTRINYFRLFFTDGVVNAVHSSPSSEAFARRERDLFKVIKEAFLNFFMLSPCGCVQDIVRTGLKPYGQMVQGRPMEPPEHPLPNDVYTTYLAAVEHYTAKAPAISQQRTAYREFMKAQVQT